MAGGRRDWFLHSGRRIRDREDFERFTDIVDGYKARRAFTIPMQFSSRDNDLLQLDSITIRDFLGSHGLNSPALHWYVNYACRDDYGCDYGDVSAWAGLHYFGAGTLTRVPCSLGLKATDGSSGGCVRSSRHYPDRFTGVPSE